MLDAIAPQACDPPVTHCGGPGHSGIFISGQFFKGNREEKRGTRKDTVSFRVLILRCCQGDALHKQLQELIYLMVG